MPETPETEDLSYLNNLDTKNEVEEEEIESTPEPEEEEVVEEQESEETSEAEEEEEPVEGKSAAARQAEGEVEVPRKRGETRIQKLANERAVEREARIRAEAERDALLKFRPSAPAQDNSEAIRLRNEKLALMEPLERTVYIQNETLEQIKQQQLITELRSEDRADKAAYDARAVVDPRYARNKDEVEKELREFRSKGINATREQALAQVLGRKLLGEKPRKAARDAAAQRVASTKGKPTNARSNPAAPVGKGDSLADLESRLKGKSFNTMFNN